MMFILLRHLVKLVISGRSLDIRQWYMFSQQKPAYKGPKINLLAFSKPPIAIIHAAKNEVIPYIITYT